MPDARIEELKALLPQGLLQDWVRLGTRLVRLVRDRHHPDKHNALLNRLLAQARASVALRAQRQAGVQKLRFDVDSLSRRKLDMRCWIYRLKDVARFPKARSFTSSSVKRQVMTFDA
jgi:hypothetical protein